MMNEELTPETILGWLPPAPPRQDWRVTVDEDAVVIDLVKLGWLGPRVLQSATLVRAPGVDDSFIRVMLATIQWDLSC